MAPWRGTEPGVVVFGELEIRPALPDEMPCAAAQLKNQHDLGARREIGRALVQTVHSGECWAALLS